MQLLQSTSFQTDFTIHSFFNRLKQKGKLMGALCTECKVKMIPPRPVCSCCMSSNLEWFDLPNEGKVTGFSQIHVTNDAFRSFVPYTVGIVDLGDGMRVPGIIKNVTVEQLWVGKKMRIEVRQASSKEPSQEEQGFPDYWFEAA